jgi:hypothetical protein
MLVDNHAQAKALIKKLQANLPIKVRVRKEIAKKMLLKGEKINPEIDYYMDIIQYMGDEGGITCSLVSETDDPETIETVYAFSLTHLTIDPEHPLASEVREYQRQRVHNLRLQNQSGFAAELLNFSQKKRKKGNGGFGQ